MCWGIVIALTLPKGLKAILDMGQPAYAGPNQLTLLQFGPAPFSYSSIQKFEVPLMIGRTGIFQIWFSPRQEQKCQFEPY